MHLLKKNVQGTQKPGLKNDIEILVGQAVLKLQIKIAKMLVLDE